MKFTITDYHEKKIIFEVGKDIPATSDVSIDFSAVGEDMYRKIRYNFSEDVLRVPVIETSLLFSVGQKECKDFRMIERHYFKGIYTHKHILIYICSYKYIHMLICIY